MTPSPCDEYRERLELEAEQALSPDDAAEVGNHLASCPGCRAFRQALLAEARLFREVLDPAACDQAAGAASLAYALTREAQSRLLRRAWGAAAAALLLAVLAGHLSPGKGTPPAPVQPVPEQADAWRTLSPLERHLLASAEARPGIPLSEWIRILDRKGGLR